MIKSVRIRLEIIVHCLCGSDRYIVAIPFKFGNHRFLAPLMYCQENSCFQLYNYHIPVGTTQTVYIYLLINPAVQIALVCCVACEA